MKIKNYPFVKEPFSLILHNFQAFERLFLLELLVENIFFTYVPSIKLFFVFKVFQYSSNAFKGFIGGCTLGGGGGWLAVIFWEMGVFTLDFWGSDCFCWDILGFDYYYYY